MIVLFNATRAGMKFFECSARTRQNVDEAFLTLARDVVGRLLAGGNGGVQPGKQTVNVTAHAGLNDKKPAAGCCGK